MNPLPCMYAIVRYAPFVETGEFANVGIILMAPTGRYFGFKLMDKRHGRVTRFFEQTNPQLFRAMMTTLGQELHGKHQLLEQHGFADPLAPHDAEFAKRLFMEITRPREAIIRFSEVRGVLADAPAAKLQALYDHYVARDFVNKKSHETHLEHGIRRLLADEGIVNRFAPMKVGNEDYHVSFPFVEETGAGVPLKAIKPLYLAHDQPSKILDHGGQWLFRIQALKKRKLLPDQILFAVDGPQGSGARARAFSDVVLGLQEAGANVLPVLDSQRIVQFSHGVAPGST